jgi:cell division protein FtsW
MKSVDYKLFFTVLLLVIFWMIMISSVSVWGSFRVTSAQASAWMISEAYNHFYVLRNIAHVIISFSLIWFLVKIKYTFFEKYSKHIFSFSIILLIIVLVIWANYKWARWWISIPWVPFNIQPTEFLKFALIVYLAAFFKQYKKYLHTFNEWFVPFTIVLWVILLLVGAQPDFGTILIIVPISFMMFFLAWANIRYLLLMFAMWVIVALSVYTIWDYDKETWKNLNNFWYITHRIDNFLADNQEAIANKTINYQTEQALIAIWSGGFAWLWFGQSVQKFWYLPEVQWDFIFSVIVEELGFRWAFIFLCMYMYIWYRWLLISLYSSDLFAKYAAFWITVWILLQAFINIGVNLNIVPLTGITLPFISYGWSSLLSLSLWLALLLSISREINPDEYKKKMKRKKYFSIRKKLWL